MKNVLLSLLFCVVYQLAEAQRSVPELKNNTTLHYECKLHGQTRALKLTANVSSDTLVFHLETRGVKSDIVIAQQALKNGTALSFNQGENTAVLHLKPTETFFMISRSAYQDLVQNNKFVYNNTTYDVINQKPNDEVFIEGKAIDVLHVKAQIDNTEIWIIKNPDFPIICKVDKNPLGIDFTLMKIEQK